MFDVNSFVSKNVLDKIQSSNLSSNSYQVLVNLLILGRVHTVKFYKYLSKSVDILEWYDNIFTPVLSGQADPPEGLIKDLKASNKYFRNLASLLNVDFKILLSSSYFSFLVNSESFNFSDFLSGLNNESNNEVIVCVHQ